MILGGVLAHDHRVPLWAVLVAAIAGAIAGDSLGYEIGRRFGSRVTAWVPHRVLKPHHLDRAQAAVRRFGGKAVFLGRFTTTLRVLVPGFAGMSRVPYRTFLAWNAAGGAIWATFFALLGFLAGTGWQEASRQVALWGLVLAAVAVLLLGLYLLYKRRKTTRKPGP